MTLYLYNTESRQKEPLIPMDGKLVRMYTCGPTIYDFAHIGNFRTYVFEDILRRTIKFFGFAVHQVMNLTDVDDKTIRGALAKNMSLKEYTEPFRIAFFEDLKTLHIEPVEHYPAATDYIPAMIVMIQRLLDKGCAYRGANGSIYFSIRHFPAYGRLSHLQIDELKINASGENEADEYEKENASDFVLWKAHDPKRDGSIRWESPFGPGRPGWHIECSAMAMSLLGESIDIHCGGIDNLFPHHENEIAQSECCSGRPFVRLWLHSEHLLVDHKKMSKSLGNFYTLRDLIQKGYTGAEVRYLLLSGHYRMQLNFTFAGLDAARAALSRLRDVIDRMRSIQKEGTQKEGTKVSEVADRLERADREFKAAFADDLHTPGALAVLFELVRELNSLADAERLSSSDAEETLQLFAKWDRILGVLPLEQSESAPPHLEQLLAKRELARREKNWPLSDRLRDEILAQGYLIEDTPTGARLKKGAR